MEKLINVKREKPKHFMNVQPHFYDAILKGSFRLRGKDYSDGDLIIYYEVGTPIGIPSRPPLRRRLRLERGKE